MTHSIEENGWPSSRPDSLDASYPHATQTYGLCTVGFTQVKAAGLALVFDQHDRTVAILCKDKAGTDGGQV